MPTCVWQVKYLTQYRTKILVLADDFLLRIKFSTADTLHTQYQIQVSPFALFEFWKLKESPKMKLSKKWIITCSCYYLFNVSIYVIFSWEQVSINWYPRGSRQHFPFLSLTFPDYDNQIRLMRYLKMIKSIPLNGLHSTDHIHILTDPRSKV